MASGVPRRRVEELVAKYAPHKLRSWEPISLDDSETSTNVSFFLDDDTESFATNVSQISEWSSSNSCSPLNEENFSSPKSNLKDRISQQEELLQSRIDHLEVFCKDLEEKRQKYVLESHNNLHKHKMIISTQASSIQTLKGQISDLQKQLSIATASTVEEWSSMQKEELRTLCAVTLNNKDLQETQGMSLRQFVQFLLLHEVSAMKTKYETSCSEVDRLKKKCIDQNSEISRLRRETVRHTGDHTSLTEELEQQLAETKAHLERVSTELTEAHLKLEQTPSHVSDHLQASSTDNISDLLNTIELLKLDKGYLSKQVHSIQERNQELVTAADELRLKNRDLKETQQELYKKLLATKEDSKADFEERLNAELQRISATTNMQIEHLRTNQRESYEREISALRSARDHGTHEVEKVNLHLKEVKQQYDTLLDEFRDAKSRLNGQIQELRSDLKLKQFEVDRQSVVLDQQTTEVTKLKHERERCQEKIEVLTKEYYALKQETSATIARLETENRTMQAKVENFDDLQSDLEKILTSQTSSDDAIFSQYQGQKVRQNAALARRLVQKQADVHELEKKLHEADVMIQNLKSEIEESKQDLARTAQPYAFLIEELKKRDKQIKECTKVIQTLQSELRRVTAELQNHARKSRRESPSQSRKETPSQTSGFPMTPVNNERNSKRTRRFAATPIVFEKK